jgi:5,10-methylenetetrahydromethanopterin reductase
MRREISVAFQTNKSAAEYVALARLVDTYAFDRITVYCDAPFQPSYGPLLLMAPLLRRAMLGPAAVPPARMHPVDIAANTALLATAASGGVYVGLARGAWLGEVGIAEPDHPLQAIREAASVVRYLLSGQTGGFEGEIYRLAPHIHAPYPLPDRMPPLLIGTWGKRLAAIAGEIADEVKIGGSANPAMAPIMRAFITEGARAVGRDQNAVGIVFGAVCVADPDRQRARFAARRSVALYLPVVAALDPTAQVDPELIRRIEDAVRQERTDDAAALISDALLEKFAFAGNADDLIRQASALFEAGASRIEFGTPHGVDSPAGGLHLIGQTVVPELQRSYA